MMGLMEQQLQPYLTVRETAQELGMTPNGVYKLISRGRLKAIRRSQRKTIVSRLALDAYQNRVNGQAPPPAPLIFDERPVGELREEFQRATGKTPEEWERAWKADEIEDSAGNMGLTIHAIAIRLSEKDLAKSAPGLPVAAY
jgi:excisionase family DNA binding protein